MSGYTREVIAGPGVDGLVAVATGKLRHTNRGACPDEIEGFDSRDPEYPACQAIAAATGESA